MRLSAIYGCWLLALSSLGATIFEVTHFEQILEHLTPQTLLVCDIDDTLLVPVQMLGTDIWLQHRSKDLQAQSHTPKTAFEKALKEWEAIRHISEMKLVEASSSSLLHELQARSWPVMGLTSQGLALATRTAQQLALVGIDLSKTAPGADRDIFFTNTSPTGDFGHGVLYRHGILFTSGTSKGPAIGKFLAIVGYLPQKIVFINDRRSHIEDLARTVEALGIPFVGLRYSHEDARIASYNHPLAMIQFHRSSFAHILSDEEAATLLEEENSFQSASTSSE